MGLKRSPQEKGRDKERAFAKRIPRSGAGFYKGDWKTDEYLIECKSTEKKSFRLTLEVIDKITKEAINASRLPGIELLMGDYQIWINWRRLK